MRRALLAALLVLVATSAAHADAPWPTNQRAHGFQLDGLHDPTTSLDPSTAALRLGDVNPTGSPCILQSPGSLGVPGCAVPVVIDDPMAIVSNHLQLKIDSTLRVFGGVLGVSASGAPATLATSAVGFGSSSNLLTGDATNFSWNSTSHLATIANILSPGTLQISSLVGPGFAKVDSTGHFSVDTTSYVPAATWPIANIRWYCVDGVHGSDANVGYSDTSSADCGTKAKQTIGALASIFPQNGAGRFVVVKIAQGTYTDGLTFLNAPGYNTSVVIGTATNSTAGATAFQDDKADLIYAGAIPVSGTNVSGYNPTGAATTTTIPSTKVGGGSPAFTIDTTTSTLSGYRIRFDAATSTVALRNYVESIQSVTATDTITTMVALPAAPSASDVYYIEGPGVIVPRVRQFIGVSQLNGWNIVGVDFGTGTSFVIGGTFDPVFCRFRGALSLSNAAIQAQQTVLHPTVSGAVAGGMRFESNVGDIGGSQITLDRTYVAGLVSFHNSPTRFIDLGSVVGSVSIIGRSPGIGGGTIGTILSAQGQTVKVLSATSGLGCNGGITVIDGDAALGGLIFSGQGSAAAVCVLGRSAVRFVGSPQPAGTTGGSGVGLDLSSAAQATVDASSAPTVTGAADVKLAGSAGNITWAQAMAGVVDVAGNRITGSVSNTFPLTILPSGSTPAGATLTGPTLTVTNLVGPGHTQVTSGGLFSVDTGTYLLDPTCNGIAVRTASGVTTCRTLTSSGGTITVTNGSGVSGVPNIDLPNVGPGATTTGSAGIASITTDAQGRLVSAATATYLTSPVALSSVTSPTGTGFSHVTSGAWDPAARAVDLSSADATGTLATARVPAFTGGDVTSAGASLVLTLNDLPAGVPALGKIIFDFAAIPSTPAASTESCWAHNSANNWFCMTSAGVSAHLVQTQAGATHKAITALANDGSSTLTQFDYSDLVSTTVPAANFPALTGPVTTAGGSLATSLNLGASGISGSLPVADLAAGTVGQVLVTGAGPATAWGTVGTTGLAANAVTYAKLQTETASTLLGNPTGSSGVPSEITLGSGLAFSGTTLIATGSGGITQLTGDGTAGPGSGSQALTLKNTGLGAGSCTYCSVTFDAAGRETTYSNGTAPTTYTFSTGLTNASGTITSNLITGLSGGQTAIGDTAASGILKLQSTTNATRGYIQLGTVTGANNISLYDETNQTLSIGDSSVSALVSGIKLQLYKTLGGTTAGVVVNDAGASTVARAGWYTSLSKGLITAPSFGFEQLGLGFTGTAGLTDAQGGLIQLLASSGSPVININNNGTSGGGGDIVVTTGSATTGERFRVLNGGTVRAKSLLAGGIVSADTNGGLGIASAGTGISISGTTINTSAIPYASIQTETASTLLGNYSGSTGAVREVNIGTGLQFTGSVLLVTPGLASASINYTAFLTGALTTNPGYLAVSSLTPDPDSSAAPVIEYTEGVAASSATLNVYVPASTAVGTGQLAINLTRNGTSIGNVLFSSSTAGGSTLTTGAISISGGATTDTYGCQLTLVSGTFTATSSLLDVTISVQR